MRVGCGLQAPKGKGIERKIDEMMKLERSLFVYVFLYISLYLSHRSLVILLPGPDRGVGPGRVPVRGIWPPVVIKVIAPPHPRDTDLVLLVPPPFIVVDLAGLAGGGHGELFILDGDELLLKPLESSKTLLKVIHLEMGILG